MKKQTHIIFLITAFVAAFILHSTFSIKEMTKEDFLSWKIEQKLKKKKAEAGYPDKAMQWFYEQRAYPQGFIPVGWREEALKHIEKNNRRTPASSLEALTWTSLGPGNVGGRIRSILVHPSNSQILYVGSVSGGVWKSSNGGSSWLPLKDNMENLAVVTLTFEGTNANTIYAGTGEGFFNVDAVRGAGVFKSTDAGATWTQLSATNNSNFHYVQKLEYDQTTGTLWAATRKNLYKSTDGGSSFTAALSGSGDLYVMDLEIANTSPTTIYAGVGHLAQSGVWRSTNAGSNWSEVRSVSGMGRIELAVSGSNPSVVYASMLNLSTYGVGNISKTTNGGSSWSNVVVPGPSYSGSDNYAGQQAWYDNILAVHPTDPSKVFAGGIDLWMSTNSGSGWTQKTNWYSQTGAPPYVHADFHDIVFDPQNSNTIFVGNDGGIYKSTNGGTSWSALNNDLFITQFYYGAVDPSSSKYYGGTQDNGTIRSLGSTSWTEIFGGDGGATEVDYVNPNNIYIEYVNFAFFKSTNGGVSFFKAMNGIPKGPGDYDGTTDRTLFITPFVMDPNNSSTIVGGTYRVWRTTNGASSWTAISSDLTGDGSGSSGAKISTLAIAKGNSDVIYVGCSNGRVQVTTNAGTNWNLRNSGLPNASCSRIAIHPTNSSIAYAVFSGFTSGAKVYKTTDAGTSWSNISNNLPNIPISSIVINPANTSHIIIGTDLGAFSSDNDGASWTADNSGFANVVVADLDYRSSDNKIFAATHGRGMFSATLSGGGGGGNILQLLYDDGTPTSGYYWPNAGQSSANRITPTVANSKVLSMSIYILGTNGGTNASYIPLFLQRNGSQPGTPYSTLSNKTATSVPGWDDTDLSGLNVTVSEDFYVGIQYDGSNKPTFGFDPVNNGRAWDNDGTGWSAWNETYFMRATIQTPATDVEIETSVPKEFSLSNNWPNPFNPNTSFKYSLPREEKVEVKIFDLQGRLVATLVDNIQAPGTYKVTWNGKNDNGIPIASGAYIYQFRAGNFTQTKKMILLR